MSDRVLIVDDDVNLLQGLRRQLRKKFKLKFAEGGLAARDLIDAEEEFAVVVSDMQMPDYTGLQLLCHVRDKSEDTTRIMLTGNADQKTATDAVNDGAVFRFINKPCETEELEAAINDGIERYRLVTAEKQILEQTLNGSIELMTDVLSLLNPAAFGRANRVRKIVKSICQSLNIADAWQLEAAATFAQVGRATLPAEVLEKSYSDEELTLDEQRMLAEHPAIAAKLVGRIPRLESVSKIVALQANISENGNESDDPIHQAAELLDMVLTYDGLSKLHSPSDAMKHLSTIRRFWGHKDWLQELDRIVVEKYEIRSIKLAELETGMILDESILDSNRVLVVTEGQEVTESLLARLKNFSASGRAISEPIRVRRSFSEEA